MLATNLSFVLNVDTYFIFLAYKIDSFSKFLTDICVSPIFCKYYLKFTIYDNLYSYAYYIIIVNIGGHHPVTILIIVISF